MARFADALFQRKEFVVTCELIPGRGHAGKSIENIMQFVEGIRAFPGVHALSLTDNAGGNPALTADVLGAEIVSRGMDIIVHFSCKDMNRNFIESRAFALQRSGVTNLLVVTGDYPISGFLGLPKPVFDIDSVNAVHYLKCMNAGLAIASGKGTAQLEKTRFLLGVAVSPFKWTEGPCVMQYYKLEKKIRAGADYVITQLGYDARKHRELLHYVRGELRSDIPLLGSVYVLTAGAAEFMNRGEVPGSYVPDELVGILRAEAKAEDKGKRARLERAARQMSILKGMGYDGAHIEGLNLRFEDIRFIVERSRELADGWREFLPEFRFAPPNAFYLFEGEESMEPSRLEERPTLRRTGKRRVESLTFWMMRAAHRLFFIEGTPGYRMMASIARFTEKRRFLNALFTSLEHFSKRVLFVCRYCDDCALVETFYICPESQCPKGMRIGPCGGSRVNERCEVFADHYCFWRTVYWRAKNRGECEKLRYLIAPRDWRLYNTSSWANYFLKRDHASHPLASCVEKS